MNKITFQKARVKNFLSYGNTWQEITFNAGMTLVQGYNIDTGKSNGSGKSSITEIIPFGLYGKTIKNLSQAKILNWYNKSGCVVELYFTYNNDEFVFIRGLKPNKFIVKCNGEELVRPADIKSFQIQMETEVLGMDFKTFKNLIHFSPNNSISIIGAKKEEKRKFLESLFDLSHYSEMLKITNRKIKTIDSNIDELNTTIQHNIQIVTMLDDDINNQTTTDTKPIKTNIGKLTLLIGILEDEKFNRDGIELLDDYKKQQLELIELKSELKSKISETKANIISTEKAINNIDITTPQRQRDSLKKSISECVVLTEDVVSDISDKIVEIKEQAETLSSEKKENDNKIVELEKSIELSEYIILSEQSSIKDIEKKAGDIDGKDRCEVCGSECDHDKIKSYNQERIQQHIKTIDKHTVDIRVLGVTKKTLTERNETITSHLLKDISTTYKSLKQQLKDNDDIIRRLENLNSKFEFIPDTEKLKRDLKNNNDQLGVLKGELDTYKWKYDMVDIDIDSKTNKIKSIENNIELIRAHDVRLSEAKNELQGENQRLLDIQKVIDEQESVIREKKKQKVQKNKEIEKNIKLITKYNMMLDHMNYLRVSLKDENIKQFAISSMLPFLNQRSNYYLSESGFPYMVKIDGWLDVNIVGMGTEDVGYESLSGGESKAMDMAVQLACNDISELYANTLIGLSIYDEVFDTSLDTDGVLKLMEIIRVKQRDTSNCILSITHKEEIKDLEFDDYIMIEKQDGFSKIKDGDVAQ